MKVTITESSKTPIEIGDLLVSIMSGAVFLVINMSKTTDVIDGCVISHGGTDYHVGEIVNGIKSTSLNKFYGTITLEQ